MSRGTLLPFGDTNVQNRERPGEAFAGVRSFFDAADAVVWHAEGLFAGEPLTPGMPDIPHKPQWTHSSLADAKAFVEAGVTAVSCASNVSYPRESVVSSSMST